MLTFIARLIDAWKLYQYRRRRYKALLPNPPGQKLYMKLSNGRDFESYAEFER